MIYGERIRLRAVERSDLALFQRWMNDPEVTHGLLLAYPLSPEDEQDWFERMRQRPQEERVLAIEVHRGEGWQLIGSLGLHNVDWRTRSAEVGISIGEKPQWNQGYGTEAMALLLRHCFHTLNLNRVSLQVFADNHRAIRTYEKIGFVHEGRLRQAHYRAGQYIDILVMSVLRAEYEQRQG